MRNILKLLSSRFTFGKELYKWGWRSVVMIIWAVPYGLAGLYDLLQGQGYLSCMRTLSDAIPTWCYWVWLVIGALIFIGITFEAAYRISQRKDKMLGISEIMTIPENALIENELLRVKGFTFFSGRYILQKYRGIDTLNLPKCLWLLCHAGTKIYSDDIIKTANIQRLMLPHPDNKCIKYLALGAEKSSDAIISDIRELTKEVLKQRKQQDKDNKIPKASRIEVRWHNNLTCNTIAIGNPKVKDKDINNEDETSWILVELFISQALLKNRPSYLLEKQTFPDLFNALQKAYEEMWEQSKGSPTKQEITELLTLDK